MSKIVAVIVTDPNQVAGGAPIIIAKEEEEKKKVAFTLEKILDATAHDLKNGMIILVDHSSKA
jgi:hypothetical protein